MNATESLNTIVNIAEELDKTIKNNKERALFDTVNGKFHRRYNQREATDATGAHKRLITNICNELDIDCEQDNKWRISLADVQKIRERLGHLPLARTEAQKLLVYTISSLKGGSGKTTAAVNIATGLATEPMTRYRIGVIDLDPQGTLTTYLKPNITDDSFSVGDLLIGGFEYDEGETFESLCKESFCETNIPNLRLLPARDNDRKYEVEVKKREISANKENKEYYAYKDLQNIIDAVSDDFDIIIIDTAPQFSTAMLSAHYVANSLIVPIRPSENDRDASSKYADFLTEMYQILIGLDHQGYDHIKVLLSGVKTNSLTQQKLINETRRALKDDCFIGQFSDREAVSSCAKNYCSIFDISSSDYSFGSVKKTLVSAQKEFRQVIDEIENNMRETWGIK